MSKATLLWKALGNTKARDLFEEYWKASRAKHSFGSGKEYFESSYSRWLKDPGDFAQKFPREAKALERIETLYGKQAEEGVSKRIPLKVTPEEYKTKSGAALAEEKFVESDAITKAARREGIEPKVVGRPRKEDFAKALVAAGAGLGASQLLGPEEAEAAGPKAIWKAVAEATKGTIKEAHTPGQGARWGVVELPSGEFIKIHPGQGITKVTQGPGGNWVAKERIASPHTLQKMVTRHTVKPEDVERVTKAVSKRNYYSGIEDLSSNIGWHRGAGTPGGGVGYNLTSREYTETIRSEVIDKLRSKWKTLESGAMVSPKIAKQLDKITPRDIDLAVVRTLDGHRLDFAEERFDSYIDEIYRRLGFKDYFFGSHTRDPLGVTDRIVHYGQNAFDIRLPGQPTDVWNRGTIQPRGALELLTREADAPTIDNLINTELNQYRDHLQPTRLDHMVGRVYDRLGARHYHVPERGDVLNIEQRIRELGANDFTIFQGQEYGQGPLRDMIGSRYMAEEVAARQARLEREAIGRYSGSPLAEEPGADIYGRIAGIVKARGGVEPREIRNVAPSFYAKEPAKMQEIYKQYGVRGAKMGPEYFEEQAKKVPLTGKYRIDTASSGPIYGAGEYTATSADRTFYRVLVHPNEKAQVEQTFPNLFGMSHGEPMTSKEIPTVGWLKVIKDLPNDTWYIEEIQSDILARARNSFLAGGRATQEQVLALEKQFKDWADYGLASVLKDARAENVGTVKIIGKDAVQEMWHGHLGEAKSTMYYRDLPKRFGFKTEGETYEPTSKIAQHLSIPFKVSSRIPVIALTALGAGALATTGEPNEAQAITRRQFFQALKELNSGNVTRKQMAKVGWSARNLVNEAYEPVEHVYNLPERALPSGIYIGRGKKEEKYVGDVFVKKSRITSETPFHEVAHNLWWNLSQEEKQEIARVWAGIYDKDTSRVLAEGYYGGKIKNPSELWARMVARSVTNPQHREILTEYIKDPELLNTLAPEPIHEIIRKYVPKLAGVTAGIGLAGEAMARPSIPSKIEDTEEEVYLTIPPEKGQEAQQRLKYLMGPAVRLSETDALKQLKWEYDPEARSSSNVPSNPIEAIKQARNTFTSQDPMPALSEARRTLAVNEGAMDDPLTALRKARDVMSTQQATVAVEAGTPIPEDVRAAYREKFGKEAPERYPSEQKDLPWWIDFALGIASAAMGAGLMATLPVTGIPAITLATLGGLVGGGLYTASKGAMGVPSKSAATEWFGADVPEELQPALETMEWGAFPIISPLAKGALKIGGKTIRGIEYYGPHGLFEQVNAKMKPAADWAWENAIVKPLSTELPGIKKSVVEMLQPAVERLEKNIPAVASSFRKSEAMKSLSSLAGKELGKDLESLLPSEAYDVMKGLRGTPYNQLHSPKAKQLLYKYENMLKEADLKTIYDVKFREMMSKLLTKPVAAAEEKLGAAGVTRTLNLFERGIDPAKPLRKQIAQVHDNLRDIIHTPGIDDSVKELAKDMWSLPANTVLSVAEASRAASTEYLMAKVLGHPGLHKASAYFASAEEAAKYGYTESKFGKMSGLWLPKDVELELQSIRQVPILARGMYQKWFMSPWKTSKIIIRPATHVRNTVSNLLLNDWGGLPFYRVDIYMEAAKQLRRNGPIWQELKRMTGLSGTYSQQELYNLETGLKWGSTMFDKIYNLYESNVVVRTGRSFYQAEENMFKLAKYIHNRELGLAKGEAALDAMKWTLNYAEITPEIAKLRKYAMPFVTWYAKALPLAAETAVKHPVRFWKWVLFGMELQNQAIQSLGLSDDEWEGIKTVMPDYMRKGLYLTLPWRDDQDRINLLNLTYIIPGIGDVSEFYERFGGGTPGALVSGMFQNPMISMFAAITSKKKFSGAPLYFDWEPADVQYAKTAAYMWEQLMPAISPPYGTDWKAIYDAATETEGAPSPEAAVAGFFGFKTTPVDPATMAHRKESLDKIFESEVAMEMQRELRRAKSDDETEKILRKYQRVRESRITEP